ncbi:MAG: hypothetical protein GX911_01045 [Spirochaetales bacterium]|nr:hypothetical protein [Spirochaetales bacterium]
MKIIEQLCKGKSPDLENEDGLFISEHFAAVIDGCSSRNPLSGQARTNGVIAKNLLLECLGNLDPNASKDETFHALNDSIRAWHVTNDLLEAAGEDPRMRPGAYIAMMSSARREIWILGDCQALVDGVRYTKTKAIDTLMELNRAMLIEEALIQGFSREHLLHHPELIQDRLAEFMTHQASFQNRMVGTSTFGYPTLDGFFDHHDSIVVVELGREAKEVVLASDGYPLLRPTLEESERELGRLLRKDPLLYTEYRATKGLNPSFDSFDDRTYLRIRI